MEHLTLPINKLTPHPQNAYFFDDISGEAWEEFLQSLRTSGVIEPIVVTQDNVTVSGHQRVRGCQELGITEIPAIVKKYDSEDKILKDLLETNIRQRGIGNPNPVKFGRCIRELERIYGIRDGSAGKMAKVLEPQNAAPKSQKDLAEQYGMSVDKWQRYKQLADLIPEVEDFLDTGMITPTTALAITRQLCADDQAKLISQLDKETKYTAKEVQKYVDEIKALRDNPPLPSDYKQLKNSISSLSAENDSLRSVINKKDEEIEYLLTETEEPDTAELDELRRKYEELAAEHKELQRKKGEADEEIEELKKQQYPDAAQEANTAYDFSMAANRIIKDYSSELVYGNFFQNNVNNKCEELVVKACNAMIDFCNAVLKNQCTGAYVEVSNVKNIVDYY